MKLSKKDLPYTIGMVVLDIAAPIFLMLVLIELYISLLYDTTVLGVF